MKIKDVEELTKLNRTNIRFYEIEGFINPKRHNNGYRDYSEKDVATINKIKFLRSLNISLEHIKFIHHHSVDLNVFLEEHIKQLYLDQEHLSESIKICEQLIQDKTNYDDIHPEQYNIQQVQQTTVETNKELKDVAYKRLFARILDLMFYYLIYLFIVSLYTSTYLYSIDRMNRPLADIIYTLLIMFILEPILLSTRNTTLGKKILGIKVISTKDENISYSDAFRRTIMMFINGLGCCCPIINIYCLYKSYITCISNHSCVWEDTNKTILEPNKIASVIYTGMILLISYGCIVCNNISSFPLLRYGEVHVIGDIDFGGNFNNYLTFDEKYNILEDEAMLWIDGTIVNQYNEPINDRRFPQIHFVKDEKHNIIELNISADWNSTQPSDYREIMQLSVLSFIKAYESVFNPISKADQIVNYIEKHPFESFEFIEDDYTITCNMEYGGGYEKYCYNDSCTLSIVTYADHYVEPDPYYRFNFTIKLNK